MDNNKIEEAKNWYNNNVSNFKYCTEEVSNLIEKILDQKKIAYQSIMNRVKSEKSFLDKCSKEKYDKPVEQIKDLVGIRIITYTNKEVELICRVLESEFEIDKANSINKADDLEDNKVGYLSVHYIACLNGKRKDLTEYSHIKDLCFEIQVRTLLQHAWAAIEHDKSYKFAGELRPDLKRRFYLIAGVLELMDQEFEKLSDEIDNYASNVNKKTKEGNFNIKIDSTSLTTYMRNKYGDCNPSKAGNHIDSKFIKELRDFGIEKLQDIEDIYMPNIEIEGKTYIGILRRLMIIKDVNKYFNEAYQGNWSVTYTDFVEFFKARGIDVIPYLNKYHIKIDKEREL